MLSPWHGHPATHVCPGETCVGCGPASAQTQLLVSGLEPATAKCAIVGLSRDGPWGFHVGKGLLGPLGFPAQCPRCLPKKEPVLSGCPGGHFLHQHLLGSFQQQIADT